MASVQDRSRCHNSIQRCSFMKLLGIWLARQVDQPMNPPHLPGQELRGLQSIANRDSAFIAHLAAGGYNPLCSLPSQGPARIVASR